MRSQYSKVRLGGNVDFSSHLIDAAASFDGQVAKSAVYDVLAVWDFEPLLRHYQEVAEQNSRDFGCANCLGIEVLRSCLAARAATNTVLPPANALDPLAQAYAGIAANAFGASSPLWYGAGLRLGNVPQNLMKSAAYGTLRAASYGHLTADVRAKCVAVTKASANAHAVISRAELEGVIRYGVCEFLAAATRDTSMRSVEAVISHATELSLGRSERTAIDQVTGAWRQCARELEREAPSGNSYAGFTEFSLALKLLGWLIGRFASTAASDLELPIRRAVMSGCAALVRRQLLEVSQRARRFAPDLSEFMSNIRTLLASSPHEVSLGALSFDAKKTGEELGKSVGSFQARTARATIDKVSLKWKTEETVEFGHQCGLCEDAQGDGSLARRMFDFHVARGLTPNPIFGITYADLSLTDSSADTVWDLTNAVSSQAIKVLMASMHKELLRASGDTKDFLLSAIYHCNNTPWLFVAYFETLFLEIAYSDSDEARRRLVKVLALA